MLKYKYSFNGLFFCLGSFLTLLFYGTTKLLYSTVSRTYLIVRVADSKPTRVFTLTINVPLFKKLRDIIFAGQ